MNSNSPQRPAVNAITERAWGEKQLAPTPANYDVVSQPQTEIVDMDIEEEEEEVLPVTEDNLQVAGKHI